MADKFSIDFLKSLELGSKALLMYPEKHPTTQQAIQSAFQLATQITSERETVTISVAEDSLLLDGELVERGNPVIEKLYRELLNRSIHSLTFSKGITLEELLILLRSLNLKPARIQESGGFEKLLVQDGVRNIQVNKIKYGIIEEGTEAVDQKLLSELLLAVQTILSGAPESGLTAQKLERSLDTAQSPDPAGLLMRIFQTIAQHNPEQPGQMTEDASLKGRFVDLYRSFTPSMQAKLLVTAILKADQEKSAVRGFHRELAPDELEHSILTALEQPIQESELKEFAARLQKEEGISLSEAVQRKLEEKGFIKKEARPPQPFWEKETLTPEEIASSREALAQLLSAQNFNDADRLSRRIFSFLSAGRPEQKIAAIEALPGIIAALSQNEKWKNVEFSILFLVGTYFRKETDPAVLKAFLSYLSGSFRRFYEAGQLQACQDVLNTVRNQIQKNDSLREQFTKEISSSSALLADLMEAGPGAEVAFECLKIADSFGAELLLDLLGEEEEQARRQRLIHYITSLNEQTTLPAMEKRLSDPRWYVVRNIATLIGKMNLREIPMVFYQLASHSDARVAKELVKKFYKSFSKNDAPVILQLLQHPDKSVRLQAVHLVSMHNIEGVTSLLLRLAASSAPVDTDLRAACLQTLLKLKVAEAVTPALASLERRSGNKAELAERNAAVRILGELSRAQTLSVLQRVANTDPNPETRALAATYL